MPAVPKGALADELWPKLAGTTHASAQPEQPMLVLMSGVPLSGKTTLATALARHAASPVVHVENDRVRGHVVDALGRSAPRFDDPETARTYRTAHALADRALEAGRHAIHDATNLTEATRSQAYRIARAHAVPVCVVFVSTPDPVRADRADDGGQAAQQAHAALGAREAAHESCSIPHVIVDGTRNPARTALKLLRRDELAPLGT